MTCIIIISTTAIQGDEHIPFDKANQVLKRTHGLGRPLVEIMAERGVEGDISPIIKDPDGMFTGLLTVLPELKDQPGGEPWEPGFQKTQGTEDWRQSDIVSRIEGEQLVGQARGGALHPVDRLVQDGVGPEERIPEVQGLLVPLTLILYLVRLDHLEVLHAKAATPAAGEADVVAKVAEHGVDGVGRPQLLGGDVHDLGHLPVGPL